MYDTNNHNGSWAVQSGPFRLTSSLRVSLGCLVGLIISFGAVAQERENKMNVLLLMSDQHGPESLGYFGDRNAITPNLDKLAASGYSFKQAYCQIPVCVPSRNSILTGRYAHSHGVIQNGYAANVSQVSFPQVLKEYGYVTACFGKLHTPGREHLDWDVCFEGDRETRNGPVPAGGIKLSGTVNLTGDQTIGAADPFPKSTTLEWQAKENAIKFMRENKDKPWLIKCSMHKPHPPFQPPQEYWDKIDRSALIIPEFPKDSLADTNPRYRELMEARGMWDMSREHILDGMQGHYGNVAFVDAMFGEILAELDCLGLRENTLIIYMSDHGEMLNEHGLWTKFVFFDSSVRVPFIFSLPGVIQSEKQTGALVELIDLFPTIMELTGCKTPEAVQGRSLVPLLTGKAQRHRDVVYSEFPLRGLNQPGGKLYATSMVFDGRYKLVDNGPNARAELYDHETDPGEFRNIAGLPENKKRIAEMMDKLRQWQALDAVPLQPRTSSVRKLKQ